MHDRAEARLTRPKSNLCALALGGAVFATAGIPVAVPADAYAGSSRLDPTEKRVIRLINRNRMYWGLPKVHANRALQRSADFHSRDMLRGNFFAHSSSSGLSFHKRVRRFKRAKRVGENLAYVPRRKRGAHARQIVTMWINSPAHRAVLFNRSFRRIGVARRTGQLGRLRATVWTADFSSKR